MNRGTLRYHLDLLKTDQLVLVKEISRKKCYFSMESGNMEKNVNTSLSLEEERVLVLLKSDPGMTRNDLKKTLNITSSGITRSIRSLKVKGKIWEMDKEGTRRFYSVSREMVVDELILDLVEMFLDGRINETRFQVLKKKLLEEKDRVN